jgi:hypothetical protein
VPAEWDGQLDPQATAILHHNPLHHQADDLLALGEVGCLQALADRAGESLQRGQDPRLVSPARLGLAQGGEAGLQRLSLRAAAVHAGLERR